MKQAAVLYEDLRRAVLDRYSQGHAAGHALVVSHGLVAWMMAWASCHTDQCVGTPTEPRLARGVGDKACELTQVLVAMVLEQRREVSA